MNERPHDAAAQHRRAWDLIPWVIDGSATTAQRQLLDAHLSACEDCRNELAHQREWQSAIASDPLPSVDDVESGLQRLLARIDGAGQGGRAAVQGESLQDRRHAAPSSLMRWLSAAVVVEALAVLGVSLATRLEPSPAYVTLSQGTSATRGATICIVPAPSLRLDDLQRLLDRLNVTVVAGPNSAGAYDLAPRAERAEQTAREMQLSTLHADPGLRLVEPIDQAGSSR